jgi:hypothetical protein
MWNNLHSYLSKRGGLLLLDLFFYLNLEVLKEEAKMLFQMML